MDIQPPVVTKEFRRLTTFFVSLPWPLSASAMLIAACDSQSVDVATPKGMTNNRVLS